MCIKIKKTINNQENVHHTSHDWTIFVVNKRSEQKYWKVTEQIRSLKVFKILHVKVKSSYIYSNIGYAKFNALEKVRLLLTCAWATIEKMPNEKNQY